MQEIEKLLNLEQYKILKVEERKEEKKVKKIIYVESKKKKMPNMWDVKVNIKM